MSLTDLYIVRHGHPQLGTGIPYDRVPGPPLSEVGHAEARLAGVYLAGCRIERLFASPLDRALSTAQAISSETGLPVLVDEALAEHHKDETFDAVKIRVRTFLNRIDSHETSRAVLVTHGSPIKALLQLLSLDRIDLSRYVYANGNHAPTAGIWHARRMDGDWHVDLIFKPVVSTPGAHIPV